MSFIIATAVAILPAIILWIYIFKKDAKPEPKGQIWKAILLGAATVIPIICVENVVSNFLFGEGGQATSFISHCADAFLVASIPEESFKLLALWLVLRKNPYFDEHYDGIVYSVCVGLGFATIENIGYVVLDDNWATVGIMRAIFSVPGHYAFAVLMGYYYSIYHFIDHSPKVAVCILLVPVAAHGVYDTLAMSGLVNPYIGGISFFVLICFCVKMHKVAKTKVLALIEKDNHSINIS